MCSPSNSLTPSLGCSNGISVVKCLLNSSSWYYDPICKQVLPHHLKGVDNSRQLRWMIVHSRGFCLFVCFLILASPYTIKSSKSISDKPKQWNIILLPNLPECIHSAVETGDTVMRDLRCVTLWTISLITLVLIVSSTLLRLAVEMLIVCTSLSPADPWWYALSIAVYHLIHLRTASTMFAF